MFHNQDMVIVVDGDEGSGKSQGVRQDALYCAEQLGTPFDREGCGNVYTSMEKYIEAFEKAQANGIRGWVGVLDESRAVLGKARFNSREVKAFTDWLSECRDIGGCHFILLPKFHDLHKYVVLNRMSLLIHLQKEYAPSTTKRGGHELVLGAYKVYAPDAALYRAYANPYQYPSFYAVQDRYPNVEVMTPKGLDSLVLQKKKDREDRRAANMDTGIDRGTMQLNALLAILKAQGHQGVTFARMLGITRQAISQRVQAGRGTLIYRRWKDGVVGKEEIDGEDDDL